jgi:hypothetical protein
MQYRSDPLMQNHSGVDTIAGAARTVTAFSVETAKGVGDLWTSTRVAGGVVPSSHWVWSQSPTVLVDAART